VAAAKGIGPRQQRKQKPGDDQGAGHG
jgi:hypothetical protein